jgi:DNA polymerase-3 subunit delta
MDIAKFKSDLKSGGLRGVYILGGEEEYLIRYYLGEIRRSLDIDPTFAVFNNPSFEGGEVDFAELTEAVKSPPMMSDYKLIEWHHADFTALSDAEVELLLDLCGMIKDYPYAVVAFLLVPEGFDLYSKKKKAATLRKVQTEASFLLFNKSTDNQLFSWLKKHFDANGVTVSLDTLKALLFRSGRNMDVLEKEVNKISYMVLARGKNVATPEDVEEAASSTPECDTFAFSNAITERNKALAFTALEEMRVRRVDPIVIMAMMSRTYSELLLVANALAEGMGADAIEDKFNIKRVRLQHQMAAVRKYGREKLLEIISELARIDAASKFGGITGYTAVEMFISTHL